VIKRLIPILFLLVSCSTSNKVVDFEKVKTGKQLNLAFDYSPEKIMDLWLENVQRNSPYNLKKLYEDTTFTYFGRYFFDRKTKKKKPKLFRVGTDSLLAHFPNYSDIKGWEIRNQFYKEIVPESEKSKWKNLKCNTSSSSQKYYYRTTSPDAVEIKMFWTVRCGKSIIFNKEYKATYFFKEKRFKK
jgi:hypothetical protein